MSINTITPLYDRVVIKRDESATQAGLIIIPESVRDNDRYRKYVGTIVKVGSTVEQFVEGDRVIFGKYTGTEVEVAGVDLVLIREDDILVKL